MIENHPTETDYREFDVIAFGIRLGAVQRRDKIHRKVHATLDNVSATITQLARAQAAQGRYVLVLESGVVKRDWCRLNDGAIAALLKMNVTELRAFTRGVPHADSWTFENFKIMLERCLAS